MCDRKFEVFDQAYSITHGKASKDRKLQPGMFQMLSWADAQTPYSHDHQNNEVEKYPISHSMVVQSIGKPCKDDVQYKCNNCPCLATNQQQNAISHKEQERNRKVYLNNCNQRKVDQQMEGCKSKIDGEFFCRKKTLKAHHIHDQLYMYEEAHLKKSESQVFQKSPRETEKLKSISTPKKLNENDEKDRQVIERRKNKIKQFNRLTRDLPNSAFTTYYGKPAFEAYGRCNSQHGLKTHNIMPQKGENNPKAQQCYTSALMHGKKINNQIHIPRKPIECFLPQKKNLTEESEYYHLPMERPDLINHIRFSDPDNTLKKKVSVPSLTNMQKKELNKKYTFPSKQKKPKRTKGKSIRNDGLKYMNNRDDLLAILQAKKTRDSKLAYKVTECYPEGWPHEEKQGEKEQSYSVAAGKKYIRSDSAKHVIYRLN